MPTTGPSQRDLLKVLDSSRRLATMTDLRDLLNQIELSAAEVLGCERATVFAYASASDELFSYVSRDAEIRFSADQGLAGQCFRQQEMINVPDAYADSRFNRSVDDETGFRTRSLLTCPLTSYDGNPVGVLQVLNKRQGPFDKSDESLIECFAAQCGVALQRQFLLEEYAEKQRMQRDLGIAQEIQQGFLPSQSPSCEHFDIAGWNRPAEETGGDLFDFQELPDGRVALTVADATGHGIAPALIAVSCRAYLRTINSLLGAREDLADRMNELLSLDLPDDRFVTSFVGILSPGGNELVYTSAGHGPTYKYDAERDRFVELATHGPPWGMMPDVTYDKPERVGLSSGDVILVFTDGFFEWENASGEAFGTERVKAVVRTHRDKSAGEIIQRLYEAVSQFATGTLQGDDLTAIVVKRN